jgi:2-aminomuconate deaminase
VATSNGTAFFFLSSAAYGLANYPHARTTLTTTRTLFISVTSSRRDDGTHAGWAASENGTHTLNIGEQTAALLRNIKTIINGATGGAYGVESVIDTTGFLADMKDYAGMNAE